MRWENRGRSSNLEDRRGQSGGGFGGGFGFGLGPRLPFRLGLGGTIALVVLGLVARGLFSGSGGSGSSSGEDEQLVDFVSFVFDDVQATWTSDFARRGERYQDAKIVLFTDEVDSGCGYAESAMGPFYCPADRKVYIDLGFYRELKDRFGAPGDFAQAYVIAHE